MPAFNIIGISTRDNQINKSIANSILELHNFLCAHNFKVLLDKRIKKFMHSQNLEYQELNDKVELVIVVGGDGSFLSATKRLLEYKVPVLGVNRGKLGFLTDINPNKFQDELLPILQGNFEKEIRFLLHASIYRNGLKIADTTALNEVLLHPGKWTKMIEFELWVDQKFVCSQKADGLIIATPTGSTAYALSAGGPIVHPALPVILAVPMYPHTLSSRPIVIRDDSIIDIRISNYLNIKPMVSADGHASCQVQAYDIIQIFKLETPLTLIHPEGYNFYDVCRAKLGWGKQLYEGK